jgi:hypothetical protein
MGRTPSSALHRASDSPPESVLSAQSFPEGLS